MMQELFASESFTKYKTSGTHKRWNSNIGIDESFFLYHISKKMFLLKAPYI